MADGGKKLLLIVNPVAGKKQSQARIADITRQCEAAGYAVTVRATRQRGDATAFAREADGYDRILCCGGDGTLNEVISGVLRRTEPVPVGYIPAGSTNDFASSLKLPRRIGQAVQTALDGQPSGLDVGRFNDRYFTYTASFGAFAAASYAAPQKLKNVLGHFAYILQGLRELPSVHPVHVRVTTPQQVYEDDYIFGSVCNSTSVGGLVRFDPKTVDFSDGLFELILVRPPRSPAGLARIVRSVLSRRFDGPYITYVHTSEATFEFDADTDWTLDGEYAAGGRIGHVGVLRSGLTLIR